MLSAIKRAIEPYTIIKDLLDCYDKHNDTRWF